jgi:hypothetical protein
MRRALGTLTPYDTLHKAIEEQKEKSMADMD